MTVNLSTLKVGDSIKLRNGDLHTVKDVERLYLYTGNTVFSITTETPRITAHSNKSKCDRHFKNGRWEMNQTHPGDIVEIIPALSITYGRGDWDFGPREENVAAGVEHSIGWLEKEVDKVNNPNHYTSENGKQLWDVMPNMGTKEEFLGYCKFNVIKYVNRYNKKNGVEDLRKAIKYCERMINFLEKGE